MTSHESSSVEVQACSGDVLVASNWFRQKPTTKTVNVSVSCPVTLSINYSVRTPSQAVYQSAYCLKALFPYSSWRAALGSLRVKVSSHYTVTQLIFQPGWGAGRSIPGTPVSNSCPQWAGAPLLCLCDSSLTVSLCSNLLMTLWPSEISGRFYVRSLAMAVDELLGVAMASRWTLRHVDSKVSRPSC